MFYSETELIDWESPQSHILLNPRMPVEEKQAIIAALESDNHLSGHIWLSTSGSSGILKLAALSKKAILLSAAAVNSHLDNHLSDIWFNPLPIFHIGGLAIEARSYLGKCKVIKGGISGERWDPHQFVVDITKAKATLTSLVPTQIFDLVKENLRAPEYLRAVVIGGGALSEVIYERAINLGWNVLPSYGSTECASQVATAPLYSWKEWRFPLLQPLHHIHIAVNDNGLLQIRGESLLTYYGFPDLSKGICRFKDPKVNGWFTTEDRAVVKNDCIQTISRKGHFVKIGGESVDLLRLDKILEEVKLTLHHPCDMSIFVIADERLGHVVHLAVVADNVNNIDMLLKIFHERVHPYERIRQVHYVDRIPRTCTQKIIRHQINMDIKTDCKDHSNGQT